MACNAQPSMSRRVSRELRSQEKEGKDVMRNPGSTINGSPPRIQIPSITSQHCSHRKGRTNSHDDYYFVYCYHDEISPTRQVRANSHSPVRESSRIDSSQEKTTPLGNLIPTHSEPHTDDQNLQALNQCRCQQIEDGNQYRVDRNPKLTVHLLEAPLSIEVLKMFTSVSTQGVSDRFAELKRSDSVYTSRCCSMDKCLGSVDVGYIVSIPGICEILAFTFLITAMVLTVAQYQSGLLFTCMIFGTLFGWVSAGIIFFTKLCFAAHHLNVCYRIYVS